MRTAAEIMEPALIVSPDTTVRSLADQLAESRADGACVVDQGKLVGVATTMDLIYRESSLHLPTTFVLFDAMIVLPGERKRTERELMRMAGAHVRDLMTAKPITVRPDDTTETCANQMVREHLSLLPVVDASGALLGVVTKNGMVQAAGVLSRPK